MRGFESGKSFGSEDVIIRELESAVGAYRKCVRFVGTSHLKLERPPMMDEMVLHETARQCLTSGCLPAMASARTFVCSGDGSLCAVCVTGITGGELAFELEFKRPTPPFVAFYQLHPRCYAAWQLER